jgi:hypothetical protein
VWPPATEIDRRSPGEDETEYAWSAGVSVLLTAPANAVTAVVDKLTGWPGGPQAWVQAHGALPADVRRWQDRLAGAR